MVVSRVSVIIFALLKDSVLKFVDVNSAEIVEEIDDGKIFVVLTVEDGTMLVSGVSDMIFALLEYSVLKFVIFNSDETLGAVDEG
jgi:hypothetical protein